MRAAFFLLLVTIFGLTTGCGARELSQEDLATLESLRSELAGVETSIHQAKLDDAELIGGLVKSLISARLEILKTNKALISQRIHAIESGAPIKVRVQASHPNLERANELLSELEKSRLEAAVARGEANASGGLVGALLSSTAATKENTVAMLEQSYLVAKYGLPEPRLLEAADIAQPPANQELPSAPEPKSLAPAAEGPLGLARGLSVEEIEAMTGSKLSLIDASQNLYSSTAVPKSNPAFEQFALVISPTAGLCQIRAVGKDIAVNSFGLQLRTAFSSLESTLSDIYGKPETTDRLLPGSIWRDADDWMMALHKQERILLADWGSKEVAPLPHNLSGIMLAPRTSSRSMAFLMLQYSFDNIGICNEEEEAFSRGSL